MKKIFNLFIEESDLMKRKDVTSVKDALNGYQKEMFLQF